MIDAPSWCLRVMNTDNVAIENINMIHWDLNGDGIDLCTVTGATINDCMLRAYDDCITLKVRSNADPYGNVHDIRITNCIIWGDYARGIVVGPECGNVWWASGDIRNIEIRNCTVLEAARGQALAIMQELGDFAVARDAQPDHGQQPEFGVEAGRFHLLPVPQQGIGLFHEIGIKRKEYPVEFVEERFVFLLDGRRRAQLTQKALLPVRERSLVEVCAVTF